VITHRRTLILILKFIIVFGLNFNGSSSILPTKRMTRIYLLIVAHLTTYSLWAQTSTIVLYGSVSSEGGAVPFAQIKIAELSRGTTTDSAGSFQISALPEGRYTIIVSALGYYLTKKTIQFPLENNISIELAKNIEALPEVTITGTMREVSVTASPITVEVFKNDFFRKNPSPNLFESLNLVNGIQPQLNCNLCNTGDIHINGMEGAYTMVTIDGMPIVSGLSTVYGLMGIPTALIERIEVVKGPASTLYGSEAVAGLINVITRNPRKSPKYAIDLQQTTWNELSLDAGVTASASKLHSLTGVHYFRFQDRIDYNHDNFTDMTLQHRISIFQKLELDRPSQRTAMLATRLFYEDRFGGELGWQPIHRGTDQLYGESIFTSRAEVLGTYQLPTTAKWYFQHSYNIHHQNSYYGTTFFKATQQIAFAQLYGEKTWRNHYLTYGFPIRHTIYQDNTPLSFEAVRQTYIDRHTTILGLFGQDEWKLSPKNVLLTGIRYDYTSAHGSIYTPRIALKYMPKPAHTLRISVGNGFRIVNLATEDHAALTGARTLVIAENLNPERSYNANMSYHTYINHTAGFVGINGSVFYTYFDNRITANYENPTKIIYENLDGYAISRGGSLNIDFNFDEHFKIMLGGTLLDVFQVNAGQRKPIMHAVPFQGNLSVTYTFTKPQITLDWTSRTNAPMPLPTLPNDFRPDHSPWFTIANIQITKKWHKTWEVYGGLKNLFNFLPQHPILRPHDPFDREVVFDENGNPQPSPTNPQGYTFDPTYNYAPLQGIRGFLGLRWTLL